MIILLPCDEAASLSLTLSGPADMQSRAFVRRVSNTKWFNLPCLFCKLLKRFIIEHQKWEGRFLAVTSLWGEMNVFGSRRKKKPTTQPQTEIFLLWNFKSKRGTDLPPPPWLTQHGLSNEPLHFWTPEYPTHSTCRGKLGCIVCFGSGQACHPIGCAPCF